MASFTAFGNLSTKVDTITVGDPITGGSIDQAVLTFTKLSGATTTVNLPTTGAVAGVSTINGVTGSTVNFASDFLIFEAAGGSNTTDVNIFLKNGDNGIIRAINSRSFADFKIQSKNSNLVITDLTAAGSSDPNGIELEVVVPDPETYTFTSANANLTITKGTGNDFEFEVVGGGAAPADYKILLDNSATVAAAISDAEANYIGVLPALSGDFAAGDDDLASLQVVFALTEPIEDGRALRLFVDGSAADSTKKYRIKNGTSTLAYLRNGEAYTFVWNSTAAKFHVIPGIINARSKTT
jgi:hypothetical protein